MTLRVGAHLRGLILPAVLLLGMISLRAEDAASSDATSSVPITDPVQVGEYYHQVLTRPQFREVDEAPVNTRLQDWLSQWFKHLGARFGEFKYANQMPAFESLLMSLLVVFSISILLYIMVRLTRRRSGMDPEPDIEIPGQKAFRPPESYDEEIGQAIQAGNWHAAWLAAWRQFLSRLEHRHLVDADRTRTNREYLAQLRDKSLPGSALTLLTGMVDSYDTFIYGRKLIGQPEWSLFHQQIDEAALLLHLDDKKARTQANRSTA